MSNFLAAPYCYRETGSINDLRMRTRSQFGRSGWEQQSVNKGNAKKYKKKVKERRRKNDNKSSRVHLQDESKKRKGVESHTNARALI